MGKIILINHYGVTPDKPGPSKNYEMSKYFAENYDVDSEFWICGYSHYVGKMDSNLKGLKVQHIEKNGKHSVVKIKSTPYRKSSVLRQLNITVFDIITAFKILFTKDIDCIIITVPPISIFNVLATKIKGIKLITDVEDLWPLFLEDMGMNNSIAIKYMNFSANYLYNKSDGIAAVSEGMLDYVRNIVKEEKDKKMWISPLGVNTEDYFNKKIKIDLIKDKEWKDDFKIIYLGVHGRANDLTSVLNTVKHYNDRYGNNIDGRKISFIFIGDGDQKTNLINHAKSLKLNNVYFEPPVPGNMVADYLIHADICLTNLMKIESFKLVRPNKLFQYMALGKPIISGIWGEFQSIIEEFEAGVYIDFTNKDESIIKIHDLILNEEVRKNMSENGKRYIEEYGNRTKIFSSFYEKIIEIKKDIIN
ncbi:glycosyltransferase family 4 protein [Clostridiaceae bacterium 35-E11]